MKTQVLIVTVTILLTIAVAFGCASIPMRSESSFVPHSSSGSIGSYGAISADRKSALAGIEQSLADGWPIEYSSLTNILGSAQEIKEFSVPFHLWFFDDGTCLVVSESGWGGHEIQRFHWIDCAPGQFDVLMVYHPLPAELKTKLQLGMDLESLWKLLGPDDGIDITRSGTALFLWYFDDDTCLVTGKTGYNQHAFFHCRPGRYPRNGKGMEEMRIIE